MKKVSVRKGIYALCSLSIVLVLGLTACSGSENKTASTDTQNSSHQKSLEQNSKPVNKDSENKSEVKTNDVKVASGPKFIKKNLDKGSKISFNTAWKDSANGSYSACIEGKGADASEEGVGKIDVKNTNGDISTFEISDNTKLTPKYVEWVDDENLLVIIGSAQGTVAVGGNLYLLNINSGNSFVVFELKDKKQQIVSAQKSGDNINLKVNIYDDDQYNKSHLENWIIYSFDKNLQKRMEIKNSEGKVIYVINASN